jgi:hypothetical protein
MKYKTKNILRDMAKHLGLKVKFVGYFSKGVHGKLLPREKRILINANEPRYEHIFTLLHEFGHFVVQVQNPYRKHHPRVFDVRWELNWLANLSSKVRRYFRFRFNKASGKEWEANLWAMCAFLLLAKYFGCHDELNKFIKNRPEMNGIVLLATGGVIYSATKKRISTASNLLLRPFRA